MDRDLDSITSRLHVPVHSYLTRLWPQETLYFFREPPDRPLLQSGVSPVFFITLQGKEKIFPYLDEIWTKYSSFFFLPWGKKKFDIFSYLDENVFEMEGELLLEAENDVWRRLRRAVRENERKQD